MRTFRFIIPILTLTISLQLESQPSETDVLVKYDLVSLLGDQVTNSMGIGLGMELVYRQRHSVEIDGMYIFYCPGCSNAYTRINTLDTRGWMLSGEYSYYIIPGKYPCSGFHAGPEILYQHTRSEMWETYHDGTENQYQVYRNLVAAHVMAGYQLRITGPLYFDPAVGLGIRFVSSRNDNKKGTDSGQHEYFYDKDFESGSNWFPSMTISIKIGLKL